MLMRRAERRLWRYFQCAALYALRDAAAHAMRASGAMLPCARATRICLCHVMPALRDGCAICYFRADAFVTPAMLPYGARHAAMMRHAITPLYHYAVAIAFAAAAYALYAAACCLLFFDSHFMLLPFRFTLMRC